MSDSDDSEVDVCSIDESTAMNLHTGLTLVAAETYISSSKQEPAFLVPLTKNDLLTRNKQNINIKHKKNHNQNKNSELKIDSESSALSNKQITTKTADIKFSDDVKQLNIDITSGVFNPFVKLNGLSQDPLGQEHQNKGNERTTSVIVEKKDGDSLLFDLGVDNMLNQFHFESDHMAIKNNEDYHLLLRTLAILEAQRVQAIQDLEKLKQLKQVALEDPLKFVKNLQDKKLCNIPKRQCVAKVPDINWLHYMAAYSGNKFVPQITTRKSTKSTELCENELIAEDVKESIETQLEEDTKNRKIDGSNPTFNQKWTPEEQEKLEKLLILYPPEEVEKRRWEKIAKALGNRTPLQVCSRTQKYFLKLAKAKLPIPGRMPTSAALQQNKKVKTNIVSYKNSSFFPSWQPTMTMKDEDMDDENVFNSSMNNGVDTSDDEDIPTILKDTPEYRELVELKVIKKRLVEKKTVSAAPVRHTGFMCDGCNIDPIVGVRWHCRDCPPQQSVDFCNNCAQRSITTDIHLKSHELFPINEHTEGFLDDDYLTFEQKNRFQYNYLDPNFLPSKMNDE